jgi:hypothetical protein
MDIAIQKSHRKCFLTPNNYTHDGMVSSIPKLINEKYDDVVEYFSKYYDLNQYGCVRTI